MGTTLEFSSASTRTVDVVYANTLPARLRAQGELCDEDIDTPPVDAALTLMLVQRAASSMHQMEKQLETISMRGLDFLRLAREERARFQADLQAAKAEAETWKQQAMEAEAGLRDATLRAWEADLYRRECEFALHKARQRADAADQRSRDMEFYLRKIDAALRSRFSMIADLGRTSGDRALP